MVILSIVGAVHMFEVAGFRGFSNSDYNWGKTAEVHAPPNSSLVLRASGAVTKCFGSQISLHHDMLAISLDTCDGFGGGRRQLGLENATISNKEPLSFDSTQGTA